MKQFFRHFETLYLNFLQHIICLSSASYGSHFYPCFLFDLILYIPVNNLSVMSGWSSRIEPVLSKD